MDYLVRKPDRQAIRALAEKHHMEIKQVAMNGGNHYQLSLEHQDKINEFATHLSLEEATIFFTMYAEELNACTQKTVDDTSRTLASVEESNKSLEAAGGAISLILLVLILFMIYK